MIIGKVFFTTWYLYFIPKIEQIYVQVVPVTAARPHNLNRPESLKNGYLCTTSYLKNNVHYSPIFSRRGKVKTMLTSFLGSKDDLKELSSLSSKTLNFIQHLDIYSKQPNFQYVLSKLVIIVKVFFWTNKNDQEQ